MKLVYGCIVVPITLGSNIASLRGQRQLSVTSQRLESVFERLSSGQRINRASDDAAGLAIADSLNTRSRVYNQGIRNLNDGISLLNIADSALEGLTQIVTRLEELAEQSANGVYSKTQRDALDIEAQTLKSEYFRISKTTEFNGLNLFDGEQGVLNFQGGFGDDAVLSLGVGGAIGTGSHTYSDKITAGLVTPRAHTSGDFNHDGNLDFVLVDGGTSELITYLGNGDLTFSEGPSLSTGVSTTTASTSHDFNGDGALDVAFLDGTANTALVYINSGTGSFTLAATLSTGTNSWDIKSADLNGDGIVDMVTTDNSSQQLSLFFGRGDGNFDREQIYLGVGSGARSSTLADFNGDGVIDIATTLGSPDYIDVRLGNGDGTFQSPATYATGNAPWQITHGDFNGDGHIDLATSDNGDDAISVLLNNGDGTFGTRTAYTVAGDPREGLIAADFNSDGLDDLAVNSNTSGTISTLLANADGTFNTPTTYSVSAAQSRNIIAADYNNDGVLDLTALATGGSAGVAIFSGDSTQGVAPLLDFSLSSIVGSREALMMFKSKRTQLLSQRGQIGANLSRLTVASNVLSVSKESFEAAESRIRDTDIAEESASLARFNILQQAASSVLAQANQQPALSVQLLT